MNHIDEYHELAHTLIDNFLNLKGSRTFEDKLPIMNQIIETFHLQITPEQLYTLYEHTFIIPELKTLLKLVENTEFYNLITENYNGNEIDGYTCKYNEKILINKFKETNKVENIDIDNYKDIFLSLQSIIFYQTIPRVGFNYESILNVVKRYKLFFKELLYRNKLMFTALIKYFYNKYNNYSDPTGYITGLFGQNILCDTILNTMIQCPKFKILVITSFFTYPNEGQYQSKMLLGVTSNCNSQDFKDLSLSREYETNKKLHKIEKIPNGKSFYIIMKEHQELLTYELYPLNTLDCHLILCLNVEDNIFAEIEYDYHIGDYEQLQTYHEELLKKKNISFTNIKKAIR